MQKWDYEVTLVAFCLRHILNTNCLKTALIQCFGISYENETVIKNKNFVNGYGSII